VDHDRARAVCLSVLFFCKRSSCQGLAVEEKRPSIVRSRGRWAEPSPEPGLSGASRRYAPEGRSRHRDTEWCKRGGDSLCRAR
jgi:hypothetical protein